MIFQSLIILFIIFLPVISYSCAPVGATQWGNWYTISTDLYATDAEASSACYAYNDTISGSVTRGDVCGSAVCNGTHCNGAPGQPNNGKRIYWIEVLNTSYGAYAQYLFIGGCGSSSLCSSQKQAKATECGGIDKVQCNDQCVCSCIDPCAQQKQAKATECGGIDKVQCSDNCTCGCKVNCSTQAAALASQCGMSVPGVPIDKAIQCDPQCNCSCTECGSILQSRIEQCGGVDGVLYVDGGAAGCTAKCKNVCVEEARQACHDKPPSMVMGGGTIDSLRNLKWYETIDGRCLYECNCPNYNYTQNDTNTYDFQTCQQASGNCKQPNPAVVCGEYLRTFRTYDYNTCFYTCDTCAARNDECREKCGAQGGKVYGCSEQTHYEGMCVCGDKDCSQGSDACAEQCIGKGGVLSYVCGGACRCRKDADNCEQAKSSFADSCADRGGVKYNECTESDGHITSVNMRCNHDPEPGLLGVDPNDYIPDDILKTCDDLRPNCSPACNFICTSGPGGVVVGKPRCDCSTPSSNPETPTDTPSSDPANGDDSNGWLRSIKDNTDTLVEQGNDLKAWFSSSKQNSDKQLALTEQGNRYLENIAQNQSRTVNNLDVINKNLGIYSDNQVKSIGAVREAIAGKNGVIDSLSGLKESISGKDGVIDYLSGVNKNLNSVSSGISDVKSSVSGRLDTLIDESKKGNAAVASAISDVNTSIDRSITIGGSNTQVVSEAIGGLSEGLSNVSIGAADSSSLNNLGGGDAVTGDGYGAVGTTGLLPSSDSIRSAFGTYAPTGSGYVGIARSSFSKIEPVVSDATCSSTLHLPVPTLSGLEWKDYPFDLCPYAQYISMIGDALVFLTALFELFKLAS